nr:hypothetical protein [Tanacetum cinerariifolium]
MIFDGMMRNVKSNEPTASLQSHSVITTPRRITRGTIQISQSKVPLPRADETAFPSGDVRYGKDFSTDTILDASQDRENIAKTSDMPHEALPRVTSLGGGEGNDETSKDNEIDKLMALISLSFKKIYKPTNNNLRTLSNTSRANQDNSPRINKNARYENQRNGTVAGARETVDVVDSGPIFDTEPVQKVSTDDHYNVFAMENVYPEQSKSVHDTYPIEQDAQNVIIDSLDMSNDRE